MREIAEHDAASYAWLMEALHQRHSVTIMGESCSLEDLAALHAERQALQSAEDLGQVMPDTPRSGARPRM